MRVLRTAEMTLRDLFGRGWVLALLMLLPLVFYAARRSDAGWQALRMGCMGLAWAMGTVSLFAQQAVRDLDPRLRLAGVRAWEIFVGRLLALLGVALVVGSVYAVGLVLDQDVLHGWSVAAALLLSAALPVPVGMVVGLLIPRELEGMLVLIMVVGLQTIVDPGRSLAKALPLWSTRNLLSYGVDGVGSLGDSWVHAVVYGGACLLVGFVVSAVRLRRRRHLVILPRTQALSDPGSWFSGLGG